MLKSWSIQNFKPILDSGELQLAPVTVLAGRNSSGKSSLIQSILMISQTLSSRVLDRALLPNGPTIQLGTFEDILSEQTKLRSLIVGFELEVKQEKKKTPARGLRLAEGKIILDPVTEIKSVRTNVHFRSASNDGTSTSAIEASKVDVERVSLDITFSPTNHRGSYLSTLNSDDLVKIPLGYDMEIHPLSASELEIFLTNVALEYLRHIPYPLNETNYLGTFTSKDEATNNKLPGSYLIAFSHFLPARFIRKYSILEQSAQSDKNSEALESISNVLHVNAIESGVKQITQFFTSKIRYLGPLRADPQSAQRFAPSSELDDVGAKGEYAAAVYDANQQAQIRWYNPISKKVERSTLRVALNTWVGYLGVASEITIQMAGQSGVSWQVVHKEGRKPLPLTAVGVGVSQILPILVMGLLSPGDSLLLVEQPELHLHPAVQARLGDFFMGLAKCDKQCLIETHSENLIGQLRLHTVQAGGQQHSDCLIYFVDQDSQGAAKFSPIEISPQGNILNWPDGFFDETMLQEDRITAASLKKRAKKTQNG